MNTKSWIAVKCVFEHPTRRNDTGAFLYEERVLLWHAVDLKDAYKKARAEGEIYEEEASCVMLPAAYAFPLFDAEVGNGVEVWSTMRDSNLDENVYPDTFCCTNRDRFFEFKEEDSKEADQDG